MSITCRPKFVLRKYICTFCHIETNCVDIWNFLSGRHGPATGKSYSIGVEKTWTVVWIWISMPIYCLCNSNFLRTQSTKCNHRQYYSITWYIRVRWKYTFIYCSRKLHIYQAQHRHIGQLLTGRWTLNKQGVCAWHKVISCSLEIEVRVGVSIFLTSNLFDRCVIDRGRWLAYYSQILSHNIWHETYRRAFSYIIFLIFVFPKTWWIVGNCIK